MLQKLQISLFCTKGYETVLKILKTSEKCSLPYSEIQKSTNILIMHENGMNTEYSVKKNDFEDKNSDGSNLKKTRSFKKGVITL